MLGCGNKTFSPFDLGGSSFEYEATFSTNCISNAAKLSLFLFWLVVCFLLLILICALLLQEFQRSASWNTQKKTFTLSLFWVLDEMALLAWLLSGNTSRARYIFFPGQLIFLSLTSYSLLRDWLRAISLIQTAATQMLVGTASNELSRQHLFLTSSLIISFIICWGIGPIVFVEQPDVLNWFFVMGYFANGILISSTGFSIWYFGRKLRKVIAPALLESTMREEKIVIFAEKLESFVKTVRMSLLRGLLICLVPLWMIASAGPDHPGLPYFFFFEFILGFGMRTTTCVAFLWLVTYKSFTFKSSSHHNQSSGAETHDRRRTSLQSFSIEDISSGSRDKKDVIFVHEPGLQTIPEGSTDHIPLEGRQTENLEPKISSQVINQVANGNDSANGNQTEN